ncbi:hypothetical protein HXX76_007736 [Chlamydomonas incerta]|uniref:EF-hand domain-containing protein n=1 Tax=Chlamydomonas incerta TaxID=51695 RepID=A0A835T026_CHLIN|nr:hypothetical protein HXX76_007736 [Chlamydomonas incerta]|eukprot:KAG2434851.1 hypothetical protein HXX76_007736 [Chlamydomonas incerta]
MQTEESSTAALDTAGQGAARGAPGRSLTRNRSFSQVRSMGRAASRRALQLHGSRDSSPPSTSHSVRGAGSPTLPHHGDDEEDEDGDQGAPGAQVEGSGRAQRQQQEGIGAGPDPKQGAAGEVSTAVAAAPAPAPSQKTDDELAAEAARWAAEAAAEAELSLSAELHGSATAGVAQGSRAPTTVGPTSRPQPTSRIVDSGEAEGRREAAGLDVLISLDAAAAAAKMALLQQQHLQQQQPSLVWRSAHSIHGLDRAQHPHGAIRHYQVTVKPEHTQAALPGAQSHRIVGGTAINGRDAGGEADGKGLGHASGGSRTDMGMGMDTEGGTQHNPRPADVAGVHPSGAVTHRSARFASGASGDGDGGNVQDGAESASAVLAAAAQRGQETSEQQVLQPQPPPTARTARSVRLREPEAGGGGGGGASTAAGVGVSALKGSRSSRTVSGTGDVGGGGTGPGDGTTDGAGPGDGGGMSSRRARIMSAAPGRDRAGTQDGVTATVTTGDDGSDGRAEYHRSTASARVEQLLLSRARSAVPSVRDVLGSDAVKDMAGECWHRMPAVPLDLDHTPDLDLVPLGAKSALTGAPVTRVPRSKSARPVPGARAAGAGGLWELGKSKSALYSDPGSASDSDLSAGDAAHLDASLWGGHPELLGADAAARPLRTTKSFITPLSSRTAESKSALASARTKDGMGSQHTTAGGASTGAGAASGPSRRSSTVGGDEGVAAGGGSGSGAAASAVHAKALASLMLAAADDPLLAHVMENARKRAALEREKRRAAAAAAAGGSAAAGGGGGAADSSWAGEDQGEEGAAPSAASRRAQDKARVQLLFQRQAEDWARAHGAAPPRRRLAPAVTKMVEQWFSLVDDDSSGALEARELAAALSAAGVPCDESDIRELVRIIDVNHDGSVTWAEFQSFLLREFAAGKNLINGDYVLPSGKRLPFGAMIARLKRQRVLEDVLAGGKARSKYVDMLYKPKALAEELGLTREAAAALEKLVRTNVGEAAAAANQSTTAGGGSAGLVRTTSMALASLSRATSPRHLYQKHAYYQTMRQRESDVGDQATTEAAQTGQTRSRSGKFKILPSPVSKRVLMQPAVDAAAAEEEAALAAAHAGAAAAEEGGDGDGACASMYHKLNAGASVLHSIYSQHAAADGEGPAAPGDAADVPVENPVFKLTEVGLAAEDTEDDEDEDPGADNIGWRPFPGPIIPPVPTIRRPDTRAFKRALIGARRTAPAYLLQRYGLPEPRVAAAAAAASGPASLPPPPPLRGAGRRRSRSRRRAGGAAAALTVVVSGDGAAAADAEGQLSPVASAATASDLLGDGPSASSLAAAAMPLKQPGSGAASAAAAGAAANAAATAALSYNSSYGAGMTRYRRWSMYQIDPAAENPDYWQAKAAALLMRHTKRLFKAVPGAGGARARAAAAASAATAATEAASRGLYSPPTGLAMPPPSHRPLPGISHASAPASPGGGAAAAGISSAAAHAMHLPDAQELLSKHAALQQQHKEERQAAREAVRRVHTDQLLQRLRYDAAAEMGGGGDGEMDEGICIDEDAGDDDGVGQANPPATAAAAAAVAAAHRAAAEAALGFSRQGARPVRRPGGAVCVQAPPVFSGVGTAVIASTSPTKQVSRRPQPNAASAAAALAARRRRAPPPALTAAMLAEALSPDGGSPNAGRGSPSGWDPHTHLPQLQLPSPGGFKAGLHPAVAAGMTAGAGGSAAASPSARGRRHG